MIRRTLLGLIVLGCGAFSVGPTIVRGKVVTGSGYDSVVQIFSTDSSCTATIVGPRVILTAGHCAENGSVVEFNYGGELYQVTVTVSDLYESAEHDMALGVSDVEIADAVPFHIGKGVKAGMKLNMVGYGCYSEDMTADDNQLRSGDTEVTDIDVNGIESEVGGGGALLCPGDSGGPAFATIKGKEVVVGVASSVGVDYDGLAVGPNYHARLDSKDSKAFLAKFAKNNAADICGVNSDCK